jgi:hypothetical protein
MRRLEVRLVPPAAKRRAAAREFFDALKPRRPPLAR